MHTCNYSKDLYLYRHVHVTDIAASSLIPLYTNDRVNRDTLLCELGLYFDSTKAFPDNSLKTDVVLKLFRAGIGGFRFLNTDNHEKHFQMAYTTLDTYLKYGGRDRLDVFFEGIEGALQSIGAKDTTGLVLTGSVYPFLKRLTSDLGEKRTGALALIQTCLDSLTESIVEVIFNLIQTSGSSWPNEWTASCSSNSFCEWLRPLILSNERIFSVFLAKYWSDLIGAHFMGLIHDNIG